MVERWTENPKVAGSSPASNTHLSNFIVMTLKQYILAAKVLILINLCSALYQTMLKFYILYTPLVRSSSPINTIENTHTMINYPVLFNLIVLCILLLPLQTISDNIDYNNLFLVRYVIFGLKTAPKILVSLVLNLLRKFVLTFKLNFLTQNKFVSFVWGFSTSFFLL